MHIFHGLILVTFSILKVSHAAQEFRCATGCIIEPTPSWCISKRYQQLSCGTFASQKRHRLEGDLPLSSDLEPQMKQMPVKDQDELELCTLFAAITCAEFATKMRFSESELAIRVAAKRTKINKGYTLINVLPYIAWGLIPHHQGIPFEKFEAWVLTGVLKDEYYTTIEDAKRSCCSEIPAERILPIWHMEDDYLFGEDVTLEKIPRPIGFWRSMKLNIFELDPSNIHRLKEILQFVPIAIGMKTIKEYDLVSKNLKGVNWWESIRYKEGDVAKIELDPEHARKMESGELVVIGGHAVCLCGYDDSKRAFKFRNSWGTTYANNGYGYISYDLFKDKYDSPYFWRLSDNDKEPVRLATVSENGGVYSYVHSAFVIVSHPTEQYSPDKITLEVKNDEGVHMKKLNELLQEFIARRAS